MHDERNEPLIIQFAGLNKCSNSCCEELSINDCFICKFLLSVILFDHLLYRTNEAHIRPHALTIGLHNAREAIAEQCSVRRTRGLDISNLKILMELIYLFVFDNLYKLHPFDLP